MGLPRWLNVLPLTVTFLASSAAFTVQNSSSAIAAGRVLFAFESVLRCGGVPVVVWGSLTFLFGVLYVASDISFGTRASNLSYRGLTNTGLYRLTKHPASVFKAIHWWLLYLPFLTNSGAAAVRYSVLLLLLNGVYYLRARTEERHLSHYPEYVAYALEMNRKSIFRGVARLLPLLVYRPPKEEDLVFRVSSTDLARGV